MIFLHGGWPKTGTSSLQGALVRHQHQLAAAGLVYPERWQNATNHNSIVELLKPTDQPDAAFEELKDFLRMQGDKDLLFSSEVLAGWLLDSGKHEAFLRFLSAMQEVEPVTCIWTLRRFDDLTRSLCMFRALRTGDLTVPAQSAEFDAPTVLEGLSKVSGTVAGIEYLKYDADGGHNPELLRRCGVPDDLVAAIERDLEATPRRNVGVSHKQAVAILNLDALSKRCGVELSRKILLRSAYRGDFYFEGDRPWVLGSDYAQVGARAHESMLECSLRSGFDPYPSFFGDASVRDPEPFPPDNLNPDVLTDDDLQRLLALHD
jgi:hypothetical protein